MKLRIKNQTSEESERILTILWKVLKEENVDRMCDPVHCNETIEQEVIFYRRLKDVDRTIGKLALHIYGNTLDTTRIKVSELRIVGDGECPGCGSDEVEGDYYKTCQVCEKSWYATEWAIMN